MAIDVEGRALTPLTEALTEAQFPLADLLPDGAFDGIYYLSSEATVVEDGLVVGLELAFEGELAIALPGIDAATLVIGSAGAGWTGVQATVVVGPTPSIMLEEVTLGLRLREDVLRDVETGDAASITVSADLRFSEGGLKLEGFEGVSLRPAYVADTEIVVEATDVRLVFGALRHPGWLSHRPDFEGLAIDELKVTLPSELLSNDPGAELVITLDNGLVDGQGFSGSLSAAADPQRPIAGELLGFPYRYRAFELDIDRNTVEATRLAVDVRLQALERDGEEKWIAVDLGFAAGHEVSAALAAVQPPGASDDPQALVSFELEGLARLGIRALRLERREGGAWILFFSGSAKLLVGSGIVSWPTVAFEDLGIGSDGALVTEPGGGIRVREALVAALGPFRLEAGEFGVGLDGAGGLTFTPPRQIGLAINTPAVRGGGYVAFDPAAGRYSGVFDLTLLDTVSVKVTGIIATKLPDGSPGFALLLIITAQGFTPIQLGMGFSLTGIGGLLAVNRTIDVGAVRDGLSSGVLDDVLFADDPVANAARIIETVDRVFPPAPDRLLVGPMAEISWGSPPIVTIRLSLLLDLPQPVRGVLLAALAVLLPDEDAPVVEIHVDAIGVLDLARRELALDASLHHSRLWRFVLSGDMALRLGWGDQPQFLLSVGGFHPRYPVPAGLRRLERMTVSLSGSDNPLVRFETYLAVTSNSIQLGAKVSLRAEAGGFGVEGRGAFDALVQWSPFRLDVSFGAWVKIFSPAGTLLAAQLDVHVTGPQPWHVVGTVCVQVLWFTVRAGVDFTIGEAAAPEALERVDVAGLIWEQVTRPANWSAALAPDVAPGATLSSDGDELVVHPLAAVSVRQKIAPLGTTVTRVGALLPKAGRRSYHLDVEAAAGVRVQPVTEPFAVAQFTDLSEAEKLQAPAFSPLQGGISLSPVAATAAPVARARSTDLAFETLELTDFAVAAAPSGEPPAPAPPELVA